MRIRWVSLAVVLGVAMYGLPALAMSNTDYLKIRNASSPALLDLATTLTAQFPGLAGQTVEVQGTVTGLFTGEKSSTFLLSVGRDTLLVSYTQPDPDITVDNTLRVLAVVPVQGTVLQALGTMPLNAARANATRADDSTTTYRVPDASITARHHTEADTYAQVPPLTPRPKQSTMSVASGMSLAEQPAIVQIYADRIQQLNGNLDAVTAKTIAYHLLAKSATYGVDPRLVFAVVTQESNFKPNARSWCGAMGLGQLMPKTAAALGVQHPYDIAENLDGSVRYLAAQLQRFGHVSLALAAYNAGPNRVENCGWQVPQISETQNYVAIIWRHYAQLAGIETNSNGQVCSN